MRGKIPSSWSKSACDSLIKSWYYIFGSVHLAFGTAKKLKKNRHNDLFVLQIIQNNGHTAGQEVNFIKYFFDISEIAQSRFFPQNQILKVPHVHFHVIPANERGEKLKVFFLRIVVIHQFLVCVENA